ncbi:hypothetical protein [Carboxylicivirga sp. RSCT41]|uniref:hypothetical protein n=1 Tax=Carboxylicivirga agarovorans TaxID=3417570 RepID=UPI003D34C041
MKFLYVFLLLLFSCAGVNKDLIKVYGLSKVKVYTPAVEKGFTTASASSYFNKLEKSAFTILTKDETTKIESALFKAKKEKHRQRKVGMRNFFCVLYAPIETGIQFKAIIQSAGESILIIDLSQRIEYIITLPEDVKAIKEIMSDL